MARIPVPILANFYQSRSKALSDQNCINLIPHIPETGGAASQEVLFNFPGISEWVDTGGGAGRGKIEHNDELYSVNGTSLFKIDSSKTITNLGTVDGTERVIMAENGPLDGTESGTIAIVCPTGKSYFYGSDIGLLEINTANFGVSGTNFQGFGQVTSVAYNDGFFIFTNDKVFFKSSARTVNNGRDFASTDFGAVERDTDKVVRAFTVRDELLVFSEDSIEPFQNIIDTGFPYQRIEGAQVEKGLCGRFNIVEFDNSYLYVGKSERESPSIWRGTGGGAVKISSPAIDHALSKYTQVQLESGFATTFSLSGDFFAVWTFHDTSFVYNAATSAKTNSNIWSEVKTGSTRWRVSDVTRIFGIVLVQDSLSGKIGQLKVDEYQEFGSNVDREATLGYVHKDSVKIRNTMAELEMEAEVVLDSLADDKIDFLISDDEGKSYYSVGTRSVNDSVRKWSPLGFIKKQRAYRIKTSINGKIAIRKLILGLASRF